MALGIEQNSIAPQLIQSSGQALVQGIRQIGQQISGHLTEMQTKRDLAAMAQDLQGINPQSTEFPVQLTQLVSRHPLAVRDERGQMALSVLGKAHGAWQAEESDARAFQRQMQMQGMREQAAMARQTAENAQRANEIINVGGRGIRRGTGEEVVPLPEKPEGPYTLSPGSVRFDASGKKIAENPRTAAASSSESRLARKNKIDLLMRQDSATQQEIAAAIRRRDALSKQKMELGSNAAASDIAYLDNTVKAIEEETKALRDRRLQIQKAIEGIEASPIEEKVDITAVVEPELGAVPPDAAAPSVLPPAGAVAQPPASSEMIMVIDPNGRPGRIRASQLEAALQNGYRRR